jgi:hypothetical protein
VIGVHADDPSLTGITRALAGLGFELRRSWPRSADRLLLDLHPLDEASGPPVAGQWFRDPDQARATAAATPGASRADRIVLQPGGADQKLSALGDLLQDPRNELVSHRPERRAVLRQRRGREHRYTKVVPVKKHSGLERATRSAAVLPLRTPVVHSTDPVRGTVTTEALPGLTLHALLPGPRAQAACVATGAALAALHRIEPPPAVPVHDWAAEQAVAERWQQYAASYRAPLSPPGAADLDASARVEIDAAPRTLIHRDFHDLQVLVDQDGAIGVLDFDLMAIGDPALDLANLLAHLDLRQRQGLVDDAAPLRRAVLRGYAPGSALVDRIPGYEALARQRLAAVYAFRPSRRIT